MNPIYCISMRGKMVRHDILCHNPFLDYSSKSLHFLPIQKIKNKIKTRNVEKAIDKDLKYVEKSSYNYEENSKPNTTPLSSFTDGCIPSV